MLKGGSMTPDTRLMKARTGGLRRAAVLVVAAAALWSSVGVPSAGAAAGPGRAAPGVMPVNPGPGGFFEFPTGPGATASGQVVVKNVEDRPSRFALYPVEATTAPATGVSYGQRTSPARGPAAWIRLATNDLALGPGASTTVGFTVTVPPGTGPGDHIAGLVAENAEAPGPAPTILEGGNGASVQLQTTTRVVVAVVVHVPGPTAPGLELGAPSVRVENRSRQLLVIPMRSTGNVLMKPVLRGSVNRCSGGPPVLSIDWQLDTFVPATAIEFPHTIDGPVLPEGCYRVVLDATVGSDHLAAFQGDVQVSSEAARVAPPGAEATGGRDGQHARGAGTRVAGASQRRTPLSGVALGLVVSAASLGVVGPAFFFVLVPLRRRRRARATPSGAA